MIFKNQVSWLSLSSEYTVCVLTSLAIPDSSLLLDLLYFYFSCTLWLAWSWSHHVCLFYVASMHKKIVNRMSKRINSNVYVNIYNHRLSGDHFSFVSCCNLLVRWLECLHIKMRDRCLIPHSLVNPIAKECQPDFHISRFLWKLTQLPHQCIMDRLSEKFWRFSPAHYCYHWAKNWPIPIFNHFPSLRFGKSGTKYHIWNTDMHLWYIQRQPDRHTYRYCRQRFKFACSKCHRLCLWGRQFWLRSTMCLGILHAFTL